MHPWHISFHISCRGDKLIRAQNVILFRLYQLLHFQYKIRFEYNRFFLCSAMDMINGKLDSSTKNAHQLVELEGLRKHQSITSETSFTSMTGGSEFSSHMVQRYPPTYQGGHEEPGLTPVLGSGNGDTISVDPDEYNEAPLTALDDIVFEGYEHVTYEPSTMVYDSNE